MKIAGIFYIKDIGVLPYVPLCVGFGKFTILYRLVDKGYLTDYKKPAGKRLMRVYYHLEEAGVIYFHELLEEYNQVKLGVELILSENHS